MVVDALPQASSKVRRLAVLWRRFLASVHLMAPTDDMEGTGNFYRRREEDRLLNRDSSNGGGGGNSGGIRIPPGLVVGLVMYLVANTVGGIWWAATMQAKNDSLTADNAKLWQKVETLELVQNRLENNLDERIRGKIRETANDWGLFVSRKGN